MLLNEFLKEHRKVQEQEATVAQLRSTIEQEEKESQATDARREDEIKALAASVKVHAAQIEKVNAKIELSKPAPQMAAVER
jgi:hypothetical protein